MDKLSRLIFIDFTKWFGKIVFITILLSSCKLLESELINGCNNKIDIEVQYEKALSDFTGDPNSFYKWINKSIEKNKKDRLIIDSNNLKIKYFLYPSDTFYINPAIKYRKDTIFLINKISFINDLDTLIADEYWIFKQMFYNNDNEMPFKIIDSYFKDYKDN